MSLLFNLSQVRLSYIVHTWCRSRRFRAHSKGLAQIENLYLFLALFYELHVKFRSLLILCNFLLLGSILPETKLDEIL